MGKRGDKQQRDSAIEQQAERNAEKMARLCAAWAEKQVAGNHKKERHADAGSGV